MNLFASRAVVLLALSAASLGACGGGSSRDGTDDAGASADAGVSPDAGAPPSPADAAITCDSGATACGGACVDTQTDATSCGGCGIRCVTGDVCVAGACARKCSAKTTTCKGSCVDLTKSNSNCGACGHACSQGSVCAVAAAGGGECVLQCAGGSTRCGDACVQLAYDPSNCGACGNACGHAQFCQADGAGGATCQPGCGGGRVVCGDRCVSLTSDAWNCGACGHACGPAQFCQADGVGGAACQPGCGGGRVVCGDRCVSLTSDAWNCGACGAQCAGGESCVAGACAGPTSQWTLDGTLADARGGNDATASSGDAAFAEGFAGQALALDGSTYARVAQPKSLPLGASARTIEAWVKASALRDGPFANAVLAYGQGCDQERLGVGGGGLLGAANGCADTQLETAQNDVTVAAWHHVAMVLDGAERTLFVDGVRVGSAAQPAGVHTADGPLRIGAFDDGAPSWNGLIDEVRVYAFARKASDLLDDATLSARYAFALGNGVDTGPNRLDMTLSGGASFIAGKAGGGAAFDGAPTTSGTASGFTHLGIDDQPFTVEAWALPSRASGTLIASTNAGGCAPIVGFDGAGHLTAQVWTGALEAAIAPAITPAGTWTHVAVTWSATSGLRLYIDGALAATRSDVVHRVASGHPETLTLANAPACASGAIAPVPYAGALDEVRVYGREKSSAEIYVDAE